MGIIHSAWEIEKGHFREPLNGCKIYEGFLPNMTHCIEFHIRKTQYLITKLLSSKILVDWFSFWVCFVFSFGIHTYEEHLKIHKILLLSPILPLSLVGVRL